MIQNLSEELLRNYVWYGINSVLSKIVWPVFCSDSTLNYVNQNWISCNCCQMKQYRYLSYFFSHIQKKGGQKSKFWEQILYFLLFLVKVRIRIRFSDFEDQIGKGKAISMRRFNFKERGILLCRPLPWDGWGLKRLYWGLGWYPRGWSWTLRRTGPHPATGCKIKRITNCRWVINTPKMTRDYRLLQLISSSVVDSWLICLLDPYWSINKRLKKISEKVQYFITIFNGSQICLSRICSAGSVNQDYGLADPEEIFTDPQLWYPD